MSIFGALFSILSDIYDVTFFNSKLLQNLHDAHNIKILNRDKVRVIGYSFSIPFLWFRWQWEVATVTFIVQSRKLNTGEGLLPETGWLAAMEECELRLLVSHPSSQDPLPALTWPLPGQLERSRDISPSLGLTLSRACATWFGSHFSLLKTENSQDLCVPLFVLATPIKRGFNHMLLLYFPCQCDLSHLWANILFTKSFLIYSLPTFRKDLKKRPDVNKPMMWNLSIKPMAGVGAAVQLPVASPSPHGTVSAAATEPVNWSPHKASTMHSEVH